MKRHKEGRPRRGTGLRGRLLKILPISWVRFEDMPPRGEKEKEEITHWIRMV